MLCSFTFRVILLHRSLQEFHRFVRYLGITFLDNIFEIVRFLNWMCYFWALIFQCSFFFFLLFSFFFFGLGSEMFYVLCFNPVLCFPKWMLSLLDPCTTECPIKSLFVYLSVHQFSVFLRNGSLVFSDFWHDGR